MELGIHKTHTDEDGRIYTVVPKWWTYTITVLVIVGVSGVLFIGIVLVSLDATISEHQQFNEITRERRKAWDEMLTKRAEVQQWTYQQACEYAQSKGKPCLENPQWWANPDNYPLLRGQESGSGLFPPAEK